MVPTTRAQNLEYLDTKVTIMSKDMDQLTKSLHSLSQQFQDFVTQNKGKQPNYNSKDTHSSHYENTHLSHCSWGPPNSWNKVPKVEMHKFDGLDLTGSISQMERYFSLHDIRDDETKLHVGVLYLDQECWKWWQWHNKCYLGQPNCTMSTKAVCARFDRESHFLGWLIMLRQTWSITYFITAFEQLAIRTKGLSDEFYPECFLNGSKEAIQAHVCMHHPII
jgi:hypothetical protein